MSDSRHALVELSAEDCRELLQKVDRGNLAVTDRALPAVVPVRLQHRGGDLQVTSLLGDAIPLAAGSVVALETGTLAEGMRGEWLVEVRGYLRSDVGDAGGTDRRRFLLSADVVSGWVRS